MSDFLGLILLALYALVGIGTYFLADWAVSNGWLGITILAVLSFGWAYLEDRSSGF